MAARPTYGDARDEVALELSIVAAYDQDALYELLDLMGPEDDLGLAFNERLNEVQAEYPEIAYKFNFSQLDPEEPLPSWDEFAATWSSVIDWENPFGVATKRAGKYTVGDIVRRNYASEGTFYGPPIDVPADRSGSLTKPARRSSAQIQRALRMANGNHKAAARLLLLE